MAIFLVFTVLLIEFRSFFEPIAIVFGAVLALFGTVLALLVTGAEKSEAVRRAIGGDLALPAARVRSQGEIVWFLDRAAAADLAQGP